MTVKAADFGKVAVLMGGLSAEREVSLQGGQAVLEALVRRGVDAHGVDVGRDVLSLLQQEQYDRAFIMLHGRGGEDGVIQGALENIGMPYTGCGVAGSALGMDKYRCKLLWAGLGLPTAEFVMLEQAADLERAEALGFPLMIKPSHEGSSIGMAKVESGQQLEEAWRQAAGYDIEVMAERWISGAEYTASILDDQVLPLIRIETPNTFYDYEAKYQADSTAYHCPCGLASDQEEALKRLAGQAFRAVGASGWGRVDIMLDEAGAPYLLEVNTVPGMTSHSLVPMAAREAGIDFDELVWRILLTSGTGS
ncbi:D-alanine--D-alanine ligase [Sedimenticola thiotaurini]|uniref:D-alanine--D-alanine ligase n=1 Tax=Sedimenticola thiotaurini TaxID=1543721 RepID=A0A0F7K019_9GAMM|nr:D-alanine--D-alanine ligase [Sedimenticola thiotaurini]AKH20535.1 D-alanine--D-alanine ligase [Sedimenticola thiotaurini]